MPMAAGCSDPDTLSHDRDTWSYDPDILSHDHYPGWGNFGAQGWGTIKAIYTAAGVPERCALATGQSGHRYYAAEAWSAFDAMSDWDD